MRPMTCPTNSSTPTPTSTTSASATTCPPCWTAPTAAGVTPRRLRRHHRRRQRPLRRDRRPASRPSGATVGIQPNHVAEAAPTTGTRSCGWRPPRGSSPSAKPAWTATGTTRRSRSRKTTSPATWTWPGGTSLPVVIHCREAEADVVRMLREDFDRHGPVRGVMHSFTGDAADGRGLPGDGPVHLVRRHGDVQERRRLAGGGEDDPGRPACWSRRTARTWRRCRCAAGGTSRPTWRTRRRCWRDLRATTAEGFASQTTRNALALFTRS